ncbi:DUF5722 domain-containing protein [Microbacterium murale]|uniref:DUF5722 domain-containing protein n=1 Tax=Microbacterium murale TaxID=1081040 RepID=A0ABQ1R986_9MICO|nr:DUF5722 domain-containing protein [Microbacterium murale]GGD62026.1 hypothetical protein GCM10007269_01410 [Microbacterium murale]
MPIRRKRFSGIAAIATTAALLLSGVSAGAAIASPRPAELPVVESSAGIASVAVADEMVTITGFAGAENAGTDVDVSVSSAHSAAGVDDAQEFGTAVAGADGSFSVEGPRLQADGTDNLYGQFTAAVDGDAIGAPHFADDLRLTAASTAEFPQVLDKKGLQVALSDDAESLGVQHAAINLDLAGIMLNKKTSDDNIPFTSGGQEYYFDASEVEALDTQIKAVSDNGALVNLIVLLYEHDDEPDSAANILIHPDASREPGAGPVFGFNTVTDEGVKYTTAAMEFIASRWSRTDEQFGRAVGFIVGNEVNTQWIWSNSGEKTIDEFLNDYSRALRIMSLSSRKYYDQARTYTSLTQHWTVPAGGNSNRFYPSKDVIEKLNALSKAGGDFPWFIAYHPYPQDLFHPDFWNDTDATDTIDTKLITFKNIQVLPEYLAADELLYKGEPRRIILSEQGCHTPGPGSNLTLDAEKLQAACFAYAYYKIRFLPSIDSFILHRHVDHQLEGGLNLGLWAYDPSADKPDAPLRHKYSYDVFKYIDTARSLEVTDFAKEIIGIDDWADVIDGFDPDALDERRITTTVGTRVDGQVTGSALLGAFDVDENGWEVSDNVAEATAGEGVLHVVDAPGMYAKQWRSVAKSFTADDAIAARGWLSASVRLPVDTELGTDTFVQIRATTSSGQVIEGEARVLADGEFHSAALQLPEAVAGDTLVRVKVMVRGTGTSRPVTSFDLESVSLSKSVATSQSPNVVVAAAADSADLVGSTLTVSLTNLDVDALRGAVRIPNDCGDIDVSRDAARIPETPTGGVAALEFTVSAVRGDASTLCVSLGRHTVEVEVTTPPPAPNGRYDFEIDTQGWEAGANVDSIARVTSFANGPRTPHGGVGALEATSRPAPATSPRVISATPEKAVDLSAATSVHVWADSYGGAPGATGYVATFTLTAADGTTVTTLNTEFSPDKWNELSIDVSGWDSRNAVVSFEVSFAAIGTTYPNWVPKFQIDDVGYLTE